MQEEDMLQKAEFGLCIDAKGVIDDKGVGWGREQRKYFLFVFLQSLPEDIFLFHCFVF